MSRRPRPGVDHANEPVAAFADGIHTNGNTMIQPAGQPCYFARWTGHAPPFRPLDPIDYVVAEQRRAFSVFVFDEQGRVATFDKWLAHATPRDPFVLAGRDLHVGNIFLAPDPVRYGAPGRLLALDETKVATEYFRAHVHPDGSVASFEHVGRERMIHHAYRYWEDGILREVCFASGGQSGVGEFDRSGTLVNTVSRDNEE